jgi:hypothetical protein
MSDKPEKANVPAPKKDEKKADRKPWMRRGGRYAQQQQQTKKKDPTEIPILRYGPNDNFSKFKEALSYQALKQFGDLGRLIELGEYYEPDPPDPDDYDFTARGGPFGLNRFFFSEQFKSYLKQREDMRKDRTKLYALIMQYLSPESLDELKHQPDYETVKYQCDVQTLWQMIEEMHKVHSISKVAAVMRKAARNEYMNCKQGAYETIVTYRERFDNVLRAYVDQENPDIEPVDVAMDFFYGLDNGRYATFKATIINGITAGSIAQPENLNEMYLLAAQWLKTTGPSPAGLASTFALKIDLLDKPKPGRQRREKEKEKEQDKVKESDQDVKPKRDLAKVKCFACGQRGHYANKCPDKEPKEEDTEVESDVKHTFAAWDDTSTFITYQVFDATQEQDHLTMNRVLLDNGADVSVFHPNLLRDVQRNTVKV